MNEEITKQLAKEALNILQGTKAFVVSQAPDFIRQVIAWQMVLNLFQILCFGILVLSAWGTGIYWKRYVDRELNDTDYYAPLMLELLTIIPLIEMCERVQTLIQIHYAPKVFLLEYFSHLLK